MDFFSSIHRTQKNGSDDGIAGENETAKKSRKSRSMRVTNSRKGNNFFF